MGFYDSRDYPHGFMSLLVWFFTSFPFTSLVCENGAHIPGGRLSAPPEFTVITQETVAPCVIAIGSILRTGPVAGGLQGSIAAGSIDGGEVGVDVVQRAYLGDGGILRVVEEAGFHLPLTSNETELAKVELVIIH